MMNSSKIVLLAALAAMTVASPTFANSVDRAARLGVHSFAMVPGSAVGGAAPSIRRSNLNPRDPAYH